MDSGFESKSSNKCSLICRSSKCVSLRFFFFWPEKWPLLHNGNKCDNGSCNRTDNLAAQQN